MYQRSQSAVGLYSKTQLDIGLSEEVILSWEVKRIDVNHLKTESVIPAKGGYWEIERILLLLK